MAWSGGLVLAHLLSQRLLGARPDVEGVTYSGVSSNVCQFLQFHADILRLQHFFRCRSSIAILRQGSDQLGSASVSFLLPLMCILLRLTHSMLPSLDQHAFPVRGAPVTKYFSHGGCATILTLKCEA